MFYGKTSGQHEGGGGGRGSRSDRFDQMVKQQQLIQQKKKEIEAKLEAERRKKALKASGDSPDSTTSPIVAGASATSASTSEASQRYKIEEEDDPKVNTFNNDGSFLEQFKRMQEEAAMKKKEEENAAKKSKVKEEPIEYDEYGTPVKKSGIKLIHPDYTNKSNNRGNGGNKIFVASTPPPPPPPRREERPADNKQFHNNKHNSNQRWIPPPPPPPPVQNTPKLFGFPSPQVKQLAAVVADQGDHIENEAKQKVDPLLWFLNKPDSTEYKTFRALVAEIRSDNKTHMYNQLKTTPPPPPPGPPPPVIIKQEIQQHPAIPAQSFASPPPINPYANNFVKSEPLLPPMPNNFVNSEPLAPPILSLPSSNFPKIEPATSSSCSIVSGIKREAPPSPEKEESEQEKRDRKRRSRWGPQAAEVPPIGIAITPAIGQPVLSGIALNLMNMPLNLVAPPPMAPGALTKVTRTNPLLLAYARQAYGRIDLDETEWKQCEEAYKMNMMFQDIARKKARDEELAKAGKFKHEYDSDEELDGGTWEHKQRMKEMDKTKIWADELTEKAKGKHHIGDFLPPDQLTKFMEKYKAVKEGQQLDESDYQEYKIQQDNIGFKMLQKMGWTSGDGLGTLKQGIVVPVDKGNVPSDKQGLGVEQPGDINEDDDEYAAYRKRMMMAYRFRPNPMNNPRRTYY